LDRAACRRQPQCGCRIVSQLLSGRHADHNKRKHQPHADDADPKPSSARETSRAPIRAAAATWSFPER
jgi:hypothetical protein